MPAEGRSYERDLVLAPNEFAFILDETKGNITAYVGPHKTSLANTDRPVVFDVHTKKFVQCRLEDAVQTFPTAPEGWYLILKNPSQDGKYPKTGTPNALVDLDVGRKVNIPGPASFSLFPGQMVRVVQGHHLHSNQYLVVRVYDDEAARENWKQAIIKSQKSEGSESSGSKSSGSNGEKKAGADESTEIKADAIPELTMGKLLVVKGTDVAFYIPPTGIEVLHENGKFVRDAVTLKRMEYCILLDEDGNESYIYGPDVVFPKPTETFVERNGSRKFKAIELNENSGLYIKVIAPYKEGNREYKIGEELFITGKEQMIYFPRPEHFIVKYGDKDIHYAVAIPAGEARYVLNRLSGVVRLAKGPQMLLPDPRKEVIVRRVLSDKLATLWFPGNQEALAYNRKLRALLSKDSNDDFVADQVAQKSFRNASLSDSSGEEGIMQSGFTRKTTFTEPRTVTLDTKYDGAISIDVWTGYAVLVVSKSGERKVVRGPQTYFLEYDESLEAMELSMGTPKSDDSSLETVYLRVLNNKVSDEVRAETKDLCPVTVRLSYRVNFEDEPEKWFNVENYVKFLTDHLRSMSRNVVKQKGIEEFYADAINIIRDTILGKSSEGERPGRKFEENGMKVYDVEILDVKIGDGAIASLLTEAQREAVEQTLKLASQRRNLEVTEESEKIKQQISVAIAETEQKSFDIQIEKSNKNMELTLARIVAEAEAEKKRLENKLAEQEKLQQINNQELARARAREDQRLALQKEADSLEIHKLTEETAAKIKELQVINEKLAPALIEMGEMGMLEALSKNFGAISVYDRKSVIETAEMIFKRMGIGNVASSKILARLGKSNYEE